MQSHVFAVSESWIDARVRLSFVRDRFRPLSARRVAIAVASGLMFGLLVPTTGRSQEPSGLEAAVALQDVMVSAIERAGKSVVAIAGPQRGAECGGSG